MIVPFPGPDDSPKLDPFEEFWSACPRQEGYVSARREWRIATEDVGVDPQMLIEKARDWTKAMRSQGRPQDKIQKPATWLAEFGWRNNYDPPKAPPEPPNAARDRIVAKMREDADGGSRFARDWLRKEGLE